jgi:hypothetical protein
VCVFLPVCFVLFPGARLWWSRASFQPRVGAGSAFRPVFSAQECFPEADVSLDPGVLRGLVLLSFWPSVSLALAVLPQLFRLGTPFLFFCSLYCVPLHQFQLTLCCIELCFIHVYVKKYLAKTTLSRKTPTTIYNLKLIL